MEEKEKERLSQYIFFRNAVGVHLGVATVIVAKPFWVNKLKSEAPKNWDLFYKTHANKFFKDRNWTTIEFEELVNFILDDNEEEEETNNSSTKVLLEVGCGVGNFLWPLLSKSSHTKFHCFDFSKRAIDILKSHPDYQPSRVNAFVFDLTSSVPSLSTKLNQTPPEFNQTESIPTLISSLVDLISCIFVLSAIPPEKHRSSIQSLIDVLKPGGTILFRDYALHDAAQLRFHQRPSASYSSIPALLSNNSSFYKRSDGTFSYFFSLNEVKDLFSFPILDCIECDINQRQTLNRKEGLEISRKFVQARFRKNKK
ncbi:hypothetical protein CROQUDRAFT_720179 [Cronartium quercuum f. sp. fusiforme G11]|uniref:tRNA N(3)-methylcytidine methyltransferase n=1 Tax=Cronartium quercuum f. sp. fusiforme G11 TaxID=708437 RepID=A0A9P6NV66_9BASI|nr:hypothetical protein CROQUDRAFT_720179 [Cronartium quercuum f. sp. fusiforme G11]